MEYIGWTKICLLIILSIKQASSFARVCYFTNWSQDRHGIGRFVPENVDPFLCSHIVYAYAWLAGNQLVPTQPNDESTIDSIGFYKEITSLKNMNPELKILLAVGGWNVGSLPFSNMVSSESSRQEFINSTIQYLRDRDFDGIDLDWEFPGRRRGRVTDKENLNRLLIEMRDSFEKESNQTGSEPLMITAVVPPGRFFAHSGYDVPVVVNNLDFIHVMTYDYHGAWESQIGHPSPLYPRQDEIGDEAMLNMEESLLYWLSLGVPKEKLVASIALYGRSYKLMDDRYHRIGDLDNGTGPMADITREPGFIAYYEICDLINQGATRYWHHEHKVPYIVNGSTWIGYDDAESIGLKMRLLKEMGIGGVMIWALDLDDFTGSFCGKGVSPLLTTVNLKLIDLKFNIDRNPFGITKVSNGSRNAFLNELIDIQLGKWNTDYRFNLNDSASHKTQLPVDVQNMATLIFDARDIIDKKQKTNISNNSNTFADGSWNISAWNGTSHLPLHGSNNNLKTVLVSPSLSVASQSSTNTASSNDPKLPSMSWNVPSSTLSKSSSLSSNEIFTSPVAMDSSISSPIVSSNQLKGNQGSILNNMERDLILESTSKEKSSKIIKLNRNSAKLRLTERVRSGVFAPTISFSLDNTLSLEPTVNIKPDNRQAKLSIDKSFPYSRYDKLLHFNVNKRLGTNNPKLSEKITLYQESTKHQTNDNVFANDLSEASKLSTSQIDKSRIPATRPDLVENVNGLNTKIDKSANVDNILLIDFNIDYPEKPSVQQPSVQNKEKLILINKEKNLKKSINTSIFDKANTASNTLTNRKTDTFSDEISTNSLIKNGNHDLTKTRFNDSKPNTQTQYNISDDRNIQTDSVSGESRAQQHKTEKKETKGKTKSSLNQIQMKSLEKLDAKKDITTLLRDEMRQSEMMSDEIKKERATDLVKLLKQKYPTKFKESDTSMIKAILKKVYQLDLKLTAMSYVNSQKIIKTSPVRAKLRLQQRVGEAVFTPTIAETESVNTSSKQTYSYNELGIRQQNLR